jgi:hypothetical protein
VGRPPETFGDRNTRQVKFAGRITDAGRGSEPVQHRHVHVHRDQVEIAGDVHLRGPSCTGGGTNPCRMLAIHGCRGVSVTGGSRLHWRTEPSQPPKRPKSPLASSGILSFNSRSARLNLRTRLKKVGHTYKYYWTQFGKEVIATWLKLRELIVGIPSISANVEVLPSPPYPTPGKNERQIARQCVERVVPCSRDQGHA